MSVRSDAEARAKRLYTSDACRKALVAGALCAAAGGAALDCPHPEETGRVTWTTSLRRAWERGYDGVASEID